MEAKKTEARGWQAGGTIAKTLPRGKKMRPAAGFFGGTGSNLIDPKR
jgi:hypothetical protein